MPHIQKRSPIPRKHVPVLVFTECASDPVVAKHTFEVMQSIGDLFADLEKVSSEIMPAVTMHVFSASAVASASATDEESLAVDLYAAISTFENDFADEIPHGTPEGEYPPFVIFLLSGGHPYANVDVMYRKKDLIREDPHHLFHDARGTIAYMSAPDPMQETIPLWLVDDQVTVTAVPDDGLSSGMSAESSDPIPVMTVSDFREHIIRKLAADRGLTIAEMMRCLSCDDVAAPAASADPVEIAESAEVETAAEAPAEEQAPLSSEQLVASIMEQILAIGSSDQDDRNDRNDRDDRGLCSDSEETVPAGSDPTKANPAEVCADDAAEDESAEGDTSEESPSLESLLAELLAGIADDDEDDSENGEDKEDGEDDEDEDEPTARKTDPADDIDSIYRSFSAEPVAMHKKTTAPAEAKLIGMTEQLPDVLPHDEDEDMPDPSSEDYLLHLMERVLEALPDLQDTDAPFDEDRDDEESDDNDPEGRDDHAKLTHSSANVSRENSDSMEEIVGHIVSMFSDHNDAGEFGDRDHELDDDGGESDDLSDTADEEAPTNTLRYGPGIQAEVKVGSFSDLLDQILEDPSEDDDDVPDSSGDSLADSIDHMFADFSHICTEEMGAAKAREQASILGIIERVLGPLPDRPEDGRITDEYFDSLLSRTLEAMETREVQSDPMVDPTSEDDVAGTDGSAADDGAEIVDASANDDALESIDAFANDDEVETIGGSTADDERAEADDLSPNDHTDDKTVSE